MKFGGRKDEGEDKERRLVENVLPKTFHHAGSVVC
jgi:hypothetical protein